MPVRARLSETAFADVGTPHTPRMVKLRVLLAAMIGPPSTLLGLRVSTIRQGLSAKYEYWALALGAMAVSTSENRPARKAMRAVALILFI